MGSILKKQFKVAGGKLLKASFSVDDGKLKDVKITGDFFLYPEEAIDGLISVLNGVEFAEESIAETISEYLKVNKAEFVGASPQDFAKLFTDEPEAS
ncbi:TPA: biotin--protein ligase [archaeon]|jgi:lipoate-protein ligase A|uniref:lipoate--protein ligase n=1 Tax=Candidatus Undinarchaeum marinum TaxID=2756141 RepID=A0A832V7X3_9ARCH|nr:biotin--protein ligase [Candidatus Undinarchaeum marinum]